MKTAISRGLACTMLAAACSATPAATPAPTPVATIAPAPTAAATASATATPSPDAPEPLCYPTPAIEAKPHPQDGVPDPDGRIVFGVISAVDDTLLQRVSLHAIDPDGSDLRLLLDCEVARPRFSPDGQRLAFGIVMSDRTIRVATMNVDGTDLRVLTPGPWAQFPDWSPDGQWLVYSYSPIACDSWPACNTNDGFHETLWRMDADGTNARQIGNPDLYDWEPRLSPDGNEVVFTRLRPQDDERLTLMIRDLRTGDERQVTSDELQPEHPDWSPDGRFIVYNTLGPLGGASLERIELVRADDPASIPRILYEGGGSRAGIKPAYSSDGSFIVFGCSRKLCRMDSDGSNVEVILEVPGRELNHFDWGLRIDPAG